MIKQQWQYFAVYFSFIIIGRVIFDDEPKMDIAYVLVMCFIALSTLWLRFIILSSKEGS